MKFEQLIKEDNINKESFTTSQFNKIREKVGCDIRDFEVISKASFIDIRRFKQALLFNVKTKSYSMFRYHPSILGSFISIPDSYQGMNLFMKFLHEHIYYAENNGQIYNQNKFDELKKLAVLNSI